MKLEKREPTGKGIVPEEKVEMPRSKVGILVDTFTKNREWTLGIPVSILGLLSIAIFVSFLRSVNWFPISLTEDIGMVIKYAIRGVGLVIALGVAGSFKSWLAGDVDETTCPWQILLIDSATLCLFIVLSLLGVFGSSLWL